MPALAPTQRPRGYGESSSTGTGTSHPRKRPCRATRSTSSVTAPQTASDEPGKRLDELLDRFLDISSRPNSANSTPRNGSLTQRTATSGGGSSTTLSSTGSMGWDRPGDRKPMMDRTVNTNRRTPVSTTRSLPLKPSTPTSVRDRGAVSAVNILETKSAPRPFRNSIDAAPGVRSSPRRAAASASAAIASPLRAPHNVSPAPLPTRYSTTRTSVGVQRPVQPTSHLATTRQPRSVPPPRVTPAVPATRSTRSAQPVMRPPPPPEPQPSSDGDTSIDSLDLMFEGGGEEIERLLRAVDGGR